MSENTDVIVAPRNREICLSAAYLRLLGATQADAANAAGVDARTLGRWESCTWWADIQREAGERWLQGLAARARRGLQSAVEEDGALALRVLERLEPGLAPVPHRIGLTLELDYGSMTDEQLEAIASGEPPARVLRGT